MAPPRRHSRPYKVGSIGWVIPSDVLATSGTASEVLGMEGLNMLQIEAHMKGALKIFAKIYTSAKILHVAFLAYGAEVSRTFIISDRTSSCVPASLSINRTNKPIRISSGTANLDSCIGSNARKLIFEPTHCPILSKSWRICFTPSTRELSWKWQQWNSAPISKRNLANV